MTPPSSNNATRDTSVGLVRADGSLKPSYDAVRNLIKGEWWLSPTQLMTDDKGVVRVSGFTGNYEVSARGRSAAFSFPTAGPVDVEATLVTSADV